MKEEKDGIFTRTKSLHACESRLRRTLRLESTYAGEIFTKQYTVGSGGKNWIRARKWRVGTAQDPLQRAQTCSKSLCRSAKVCKVAALCACVRVEEGDRRTSDGDGCPDPLCTVEIVVPASLLDPFLTLANSHSAYCAVVVDSRHGRNSILKNVSE